MRTFRAAVVGLGNIAGSWLRPLVARSDVEIVALVDTDAARAEERRAEFQLTCPVLTALPTALATERPDLVINLTPPTLHREVAETALVAGCDVLVEKPLAGDLGDAVEMALAARHEGRTLAVMQNRRYHPAVRRMRELVSGGEIGRVVDVSADMFLWHMHSNAYLAKTDSPLLRDMAIHQFDAARAITGADAATALALEWSSPTSWMSGAAAATAAFALSTGAVFSYRGSWVAEGASTSYDGAWRVGGTAGTLTWDGADLLVLDTVRRPDGPHAAGVSATVVEHVGPVTSIGHATALTAILDALQGGTPPETVADDNLLSLAMVEAAIRSSRERRTISVPDLLAEAGWPG